jgi:hypothetical protein
MDTGVLDFFNKKTNPGLLFLLKVRSCVFIFRNINKAPETNNEDEINLTDIDDNLINNLNNEINGEYSNILCYYLILDFLFSLTSLFYAFLC